MARPSSLLEPPWGSDERPPSGPEWPRLLAVLAMPHVPRPMRLASRASPAWAPTGGSVNPFQLQDETHALTREVAGNYFEQGDWHDTIRAPFGGAMMAAMSAPPLRVKFQADAFTGTVPIQ